MSNLPPAPFTVTGRAPRIPGADLSARTATLGVLGLMVLGAVLRLAITRGLWLDEAISVEQAQLAPDALIQDLADGDRHPPLHHLVLWATVRLLGDGDLAVRIPSIVAGVLLIPAMYALGAELHDRRTGFVAALLGAIAPLLVWYSQEARGYVFVALFGTLVVLAAARALRRGAWRDWLLLAAASALAVWTHWFAVLLLAATYALLAGAIGARVVKRRPQARRMLGRFAVSSLLLAVQLVPLGLLAAAQIRATGTGGGFAGADATGEGVTFYTVVSNASWALLGFHAERVTDLLPAVWPLLMLATVLGLGRGLGRRTAFLLWCTLAPLVALGVLAATNPSLFEIRYAIAAVPLIFVLLARLAVGTPRTGTGRIVLTGTIVLVLGVALADQQLNPANERRYDNREALARAEAVLGPRDVLLYAPGELRSVIDHYAPDVRARPLEGPLPSRAQAPQVVVLGSFLDQERYRSAVDRQVGSLDYARRRVSREDFAGVTLWRFR